MFPLMVIKSFFSGKNENTRARLTLQNIFLGINVFISMKRKIVDILPVFEELRKEADKGRVLEVYNSMRYYQGALKE